ncbi:MAG: hypothetical protein IPM63_07395 [Acidobacteriota bacterium]|nr:MAG: hypothetical protein IPM63_07395 [Acidobacteriota bacterium]
MNRSLLLFAAVFLALAAAAFPQTVPAKKNSRPSDGKATEKPVPKEFVPVYSYEFENPKFHVSHVKIEHDEDGIGKVTFRKLDYEEDITEPLELSESTLSHLKVLWNELNFLDSAEELQSPERDYGHLGTMTIAMSRGGKNREASFNWTEIKEAKELTDEYKKIGNQFIWIFDIDVARRNQPLETPRIMKGLDSSLLRGAISDPEQMLPFLKELKDDERLPLIARNHAERIIARIEKETRKKQDGQD